MKINILGIENSRISIEAFSRSHPECNDYWDGNWLDCEINVKIPGYNASFPAQLRSDEFDRFLINLKGIDSSLSGSATLSSMDSYIDLGCTIDKTGQLEWVCETTYPPGYGASLKFTFTSDQTCLSPLIHELSKLLTTYPVIGSPSA